MLQYVVEKSFYGSMYTLVEHSMTQGIFLDSMTQGNREE